MFVYQSYVNKNLIGSEGDRAEGDFCNDKYTYRTIQSLFLSLSGGSLMVHSFYVNDYIASYGRGIIYLCIGPFH